MYLVSRTYRTVLDACVRQWGQIITRNLGGETEIRRVGGETQLDFIKSQFLQIVLWVMCTFAFIPLK